MASAPTPQGPITLISSQVHGQGPHLDSLNPMTVGTRTPRKVANAASRDFSSPRANCEPLTSTQCTFPAPTGNLGPRERPKPGTFSTWPPHASQRLTTFSRPRACLNLRIRGRVTAPGARLLELQCAHGSLEDPVYMQILINRPGQGWRACGADQLRELLPRSVAHTLRTGVTY